MPIKHLVLSGGGPTGFLTYGAASHLAKQGFWTLENIESIYGCSIGAYFAVVFSLGYAWDWLDDYFIKRPWEKVIAAATISLMDVYEKKGLMNEHFFIEAIEPLMRAKELNQSTTLAELYAFNQIDIHLFTTNVNSARFETVDLSHTTHPNLPVIKALQMSMAVPGIFQPVFDDGGCYIDGGVLNNFPLNDCLRRAECNPDEVLAFKNIWTSENEVISEKSSMLDFILIMMKKTMQTLASENDPPDVKNTVRCVVEDLGDITKWMAVLSCKELREKNIEKGYKQAEHFLQALL